MSGGLARIALAGAAALALAIGVAVVAPGCTTSRRSADFACDGDADCDDDRHCERGYCVEGAPAACPDVCTRCDVGAKTCAIDCTTSGACDDLACPGGYACAIRCTAGGACGDINCEGARSCDIDCTATDACQDIICTGGQTACDIECTAGRACGDVDCDGSCKCDVACAAGACESMECRSPDDIQCRIGGEADTECDAGYMPARCSTCP